MIDRKDGAKPVAEQMKDIRANWAEYFDDPQPAPKPQFGAPIEGGMPKGKEGATAGFINAWGFGPKKG